MKCYHCGYEVRPATIICPVCNRLQNLTFAERVIEYFRERWGQIVVTNPRRAFRQK